MTPLLAPVHWTDVALRLALTIIAGVLIGFNRTEHGKAAGMCTTVLVCVAASIAMIQVNVLLPTAGRPSDSFVMNDLMRLPLGILTGVGFIGGGAILKKNDIVVGVTTAATLWLITVIGLCLGGGQIALGVAATALGLFALWFLKWIERQMHLEHRAVVSIAVDMAGPTDETIRERLRSSAMKVVGASVAIDTKNRQRKLLFQVIQTRQPGDAAPPSFLSELANEPGVISARWSTQVG